jgi:predicted RNase H-like HicB family nuclease
VDGNCPYPCCPQDRENLAVFTAYDHHRSVIGGDMQNTYTAVIKQDDGWWIGWIEEIPGVNCQERIEEELLESLRVTLREALVFNRDEALNAANSNYTEIPVIP